MTARSLLIAIVLIAALVIGLTTRWGRGADASSPPRQPTAATIVAPISPATAPPEPVAVARPAGAMPAAVPAWRSAVAASSADPSPSSDKAGMERQARMEAVKHALDKLGPEDRQDPRKVSDLLLSLEQANGSPNVNGIRLDVLRQNLTVAAQLQTLTTELQALRAEVPEGRQPPKDVAERIKAKLGQIAAAQKQLRTDFMDQATLAGNLPAGR